MGETVTGRRQLLTTEEVAEALSVRPKTVRQWIRDGELPAVKLHRQWRVDSVELERLVRRVR